MKKSVSNSPCLNLKKGVTHRILKGHPWIYQSEVQDLLPPSLDGKTVTCRDMQGRLLGTGIYNSKSQIIWRRISRGEVELDTAFLKKAILKAVERRVDEPFRRLVWAESDDLPGLVIDQFGKVIVVQTLTLAFEKRKQEIAGILDELFSPREIIFRNDAPVREREGLPREVLTQSGKNWPQQWYRIRGFDYFLDLQAGQKTGFFLDQRDAHQQVAQYAKGRRVLDAFCNQGSFSMHCARAGASHVTGVDISESCIKQALKNASQNACEADFTCDNVFDFLSARKEVRDLYDLIILDPPSFARNRGAVSGALRGYKELNLRAMRLLSADGILATWSCSQHIHKESFMNILKDAAVDSGRQVELVSVVGQPADHPVILQIPETEYLKGAIVCVR